jgi:hypothetical protein
MGLDVCSCDANYEKFYAGTQRPTSETARRLPEEGGEQKANRNIHQIEIRINSFKINIFTVF